MYLDVKDKWIAIKQHVTEGIKTLFPIKTNAGSIELINVEFKEPDISIGTQREDLIGGKSLTCNVYGTFKKLDAQGKEVESARIKILDLPVITHRGTFIVLGKDYSVFNQMRLKPGVYTKHSEDSGEVTTSFNLGKGLGFKLLMNPSDGIFYVRFDKSKASASTVKVPLYSLLKVLGISDTELQHVWGERIYKANVSKAHIQEDARKLVQITVYEGNRTGNDVDDLRNYFNSTVLDKDTTKVTLGTSYGKVEAGALLAAASKMVKVYSGKEEEDDMDSLLFKEVLAVEDHLMLRIEKGIKETNVVPKIKRALTEGKDLKTCIPTNMLSKLIESFFTKSSLSSPQAEINPIEVLETNHKITAMGEGGIKSEHGIPMNARNLHPSHFGFLDPVRTTESSRVGVDLRTTHGASVYNRSIHTPFTDKHGKIVMLTPLDTANKVMGFAGQDGKKIVRVLHNGEMKEVDRSKVDYWMTDPKDTFTYTSNLTPFMQNDQGNRITMASRFETQAVPLVNREAPNVQIKATKAGSTVEKDIGENFLTPKSPVDGTVTEVTDNYIAIGKNKVELYHIHPLNEKSVVGSTKVNILKESGSIWRGEIKDYSFCESDKIQSIDTELKTSAWMPITAYTKHVNDKKLYEVKYKSGRTVVVTEDHSLITINDSGELTQVLPCDVAVGTTMSPIVMLPVIESIGNNYDSYLYGTIAGLYLSEGYLGTGSTGALLCIACKDHDRQLEVLNLIKSLSTDYHPYINGGNICITNIALATWLLENFGRISKSKFISNAIFSYSLPFRQGLVAGYMGGDGCLDLDALNGMQVWALTTSEALRNDLVDILMSLGIFSTKMFRDKKHLSEKWNDGYAFRVLNADLSKLDVWFFYTDRQAKYMSYKKDFYRSSIYTRLPVTKNGRKMLSNGFGGCQPKFIQKTVLEGFVAKHRAIGNTSVYGAWAKSDILWDTIVSIEPAEPAKYDAFVYDFEVSMSNVFAVNNGIIVHNTFLNMKPIVKVGDKVKKGQMLADSNFTKNGTLALGTNLSTAYIAYKGWNHEDGIVISDSAAKKLTSQHMYTKELELNDGTYIDKNRVIQNFPSKVTSAQAKKLDSEGVAIKGEVYNKGDILVAALSKKDLTRYDMMLKKMQGALSNPYKDASIYWDHDRPGTVTDVVRNKSMVKVVLITEDEMRVGDKLCFSEDTEYLTESGWKWAKDVTLQDKICCLEQSTNEIVYSYPEEIMSYDHSGNMYHIKNTALDLLVTLNHNMYVKQRNKDNYELIQAQQVIGKRVRYKRNGINVNIGMSHFELPAIDGFESKKLDIIPFLRFLGYYLSEGSCYDAGKGNYVISIAQTKKENPEEYADIVTTITTLGFNPIKGEEYVRIYSKQLFEYVKQFGKAHEKHIPRVILAQLSLSQSKHILNTLMAGDGHWTKTGTGIYTTSSKQLADDVQELALKAGYAGVIKPKKEAGLVTIIGKECWCRDIYIVSICLKKLEPQVNHGHAHQQNTQIEELVPYDGKVYCCTVPTHVLYVRRNGKPIWCGNSNRHGGKGTVTLILPDSEMPKLSNGKPVDQLLNPAGVISRVNPGQLYETMAGKIAEKTHKTYVTDNFSNDDSSKLLLKQLKDHNIKMEEPLYDGNTNKKLGDVFVGNQYTLKLHKMTEGNFAARSTKAYDINLQPARGGESGAKAVGLQDVYALLGHNARANLHEMAAYKSQDNAEFWNAIRLGLPIPKAKEPFAFNKFKAIVGASGINVAKDDTAYTISPLSDKNVLENSNGAVTSGTLLVSGVDKYKAEKGGLFDEEITGGEKGTNWSHINLAEPVVNPLFAGVVKVLLHGEDLDTMKASTVKAELAKINVPKRIESIKKELTKSKGSARDKLLKELKYLSALQKMKMKPSDYVLTKFPVLPPQFRPIYDSQTGGAPMVSDVNYLYRDMINVNSELEKLKDFPDADPTKIKLRKALQQSAGAIIGIEKPVNKKSEKQGIQGFMPLLTGTKVEGGGTSKESFFHRKIMKRNQDMTGRGTILPDPNLHIDNVKIPVDMANELYKPFVINNLVKKGFNVTDAMREVKDRTETATAALGAEMGKRPVLLNRAPTLHKYNILAFKPIPVEGKSIFIPPLVIKGFAADFDGDSVSGDTEVLIQTDKGVELKQIKDVE